MKTLNSIGCSLALMFVAPSSSETFYSTSPSKGVCRVVHESTESDEYKPGSDEFSSDESSPIETSNLPGPWTLDVGPMQIHRKGYTETSAGKFGGYWAIWCIGETTDCMVCTQGNNHGCVIAPKCPYSDASGVKYCQ